VAWPVAKKMRHCNYESEHLAGHLLFHGATDVDDVIGDDAVWRGSTRAALEVHRGMGISSPRSNLGPIFGIICSSNWAHCVEEEDWMSRRAGSFTGGALAGSVYLAVSLSVSAMAAGVSPPDLAPNPSVGWFAYAREFIPPASGAGPVRQDPAHPHVSNDDFRVTGRQPTFPVGDPNNPILQPWASDKIRKRNELILSGKPVFSPHASCADRRSRIRALTNDEAALFRPGAQGSGDDIDELR
jgi:hypothetical protein